MAVKDYPAQPGRNGYVVIYAYSDEIDPDTGEQERDHNHYIVIRDCLLCGEESRTLVPGQGLWNWEHGKTVHEAFPFMEAGDREQLISGSHGACFDLVFEDDSE